MKTVKFIKVASRSWPEFRDDLLLAAEIVSHYRAGGCLSDVGVDNLKLMAKRLRGYARDAQ